MCFFKFWEWQKFFTKVAFVILWPSWIKRMCFFKSSSWKNVCLCGLRELRECVFSNHLHEKCFSTSVTFVTFTNYKDVIQNYFEKMIFHIICTCDLFDLHELCELISNWKTKCNISVADIANIFQYNSLTAIITKRLLATF